MPPGRMDESLCWQFYGAAKEKGRRAEGPWYSYDDACQKQLSSAFKKGLPEVVIVDKSDGGSCTCRVNFKYMTHKVVASGHYSNIRYLPVGIKDKRVGSLSNDEKKKPMEAQLDKFSAASEINAISYIDRFWCLIKTEHADPTTPKPGETPEEAEKRCKLEGTWVSNVRFKKEVVPASTADPCKGWFQWPSSAVRFGALKEGNDIIQYKYAIRG